MATELLPHDMPVQDLYRGAGPAGMRHPRSRRSLSLSRRRRPSFDDLARAIVAALASALLVLLAAFGLVYLMRTDAFSPSSGANEEGFVDVPVERVVTDLLDGRHALVSLTLRVREGAAPAGLVAVAAYTPTPAGGSERAERVAAARHPPNAESIVREQVTLAVRGMTFDAAAPELRKTRLKECVRDAVNAALPGEPVSEVYLREYLVK
jgi:flagellar basal body-associated protein FliL